MSPSEACNGEQWPTINSGKLYENNLHPAASRLAVGIASRVSVKYGLSAMASFGGWLAFGQRQTMGAPTETRIHWGDRPRSCNNGQGELPKD